MSDLANSNSNQFDVPERSPGEWFNELQGRVEHILESRSLTANGVSMQLPEDDLGLTAWMRLGLYVEQLRGLETTVADVALSARWGRTENSADLVDTWLSRSNLEVETNQLRNLGSLALLDISVTEAERAVFNL